MCTTEKFVRLLPEIIHFLKEKSYRREACIIINSSPTFQNLPIEMFFFCSVKVLYRSYIILSASGAYLDETYIYWAAQFAAKISRLNYLGQKVDESRLTVTADSTFRPRLPFMYHKTKGIGFVVSLDQQNFTLEFFREKSKRIRTECNNRLHPSPMSSLHVSKFQKNRIQCFIE